jgi:acyl transferase domain-containing protein/D-arabinose 1-dehydrogenase-like Zn-dependent alcohol dehydrogenase/acyl carrier protein
MGTGTEAEASFWAAVDGGDLPQLSRTLNIDSHRPLADLLPELAAWRRREQDRSITGTWRYRIAWTPVPDPSPAVLAGTWLVILPADCAAGSQALAALHSSGAETAVLTVTPGDVDRTALAARITDASDTAAEFSGVLSLLALDEIPLPGYPALPAGLAATQALIQALGDAAVAAPLWVLTQGAVAVSGEATLASPVQAMTWGMGRVAALECPERWGGLIDLPPAWDEQAAIRLCAMLGRDTAEDQIAIRPAVTMARRLTRAPRPPAGRTWTPRGTILVTGGTGGIAGHVARWLADRGAPQLVLASRSGPSASGAAARAAALAAAGTTAHVIECDIARRTQVAGLLDWIAVAGPPLTSVMHTAGLGQATPLNDATVSELAALAAAKFAGAAHLDELTAGLSLERFVLFSSIAATWGSGSQPGYAAVNAYLDALAQQRRGRGLPATSVAWGTWAGDGMATWEEAARLEAAGLRLMDPAAAITALEQAIEGDETLLAVADVDWARFIPPFTLRRPSPLIQDLPEARQPSAGPADGIRGSAGSTLARQLAGEAPADQHRILTSLIRTQAAIVLGHATSEAIPADHAFGEMGFDSLTALEVAARLSEATGLKLPATMVFDYPTPVLAAHFILEELLGAPAGEVIPAAAPAVTGEPVAIVGMGCRFPGGATDLDGLWELVATGGDAISAFPLDRGWDTAGPGDADVSYARRGGFVADAAGFDAGFFGISPREALAMDPQQRLLLEVCWEALERAGIDPASLRGTATGVFAGATTSGYGADGVSDGYRLAGTAPSVISGRVSYTLGLEGPAVTVDTACSSSLVALHLACQALRAGECDLALAGGVTVMTTPGTFAEFARQGGLAADGRCKAFGATADGTGWSEGAGVLVVERLSDARRAGHQVLAVVAGSAVNQDGASNGLTAPNGPSQQRVIRAALAAAGLSPDQVDAVEAHGTGTVLGDPIEAQALIAAYGQDRPGERPLWLGSVKSNLGHTQSASGVAGVIKMVLALRHGTLPATLHADVPSPHVDWSAGSVRLLTEPVPWRANGRPRRAGVSSFGVSGTNAHVIIAEQPPSAEVTAGDVAAAVPAGSVPVVGSGALAWPVSGRGEHALAAQARRLAAWLETHPDADAAAVGWSLATTRTSFEHRAVITGAGREELAAGLAALAAGEPAAAVVTGAVAPGGPGKTVLVFPGQGGQWAGMGLQLAAASPVFAARLAECAAALAPYADWDLHQVLGDAAALERVEVVQPALWAVMVSLAAVWQAAGITPDAVAGHSQGEIAAATVAGILSLDDAARVVALRSRALTALAGRGGMVSLAAPAAAVREMIAAWGVRLSVATVNGPDATVVSGDPAAVAELAAACQAAGTRARLLPVDYASHSAQVAEIREEVLAALDGITPSPAVIPMISAMTGKYLRGTEATAAYWYESLRAPVEFSRAITVLAQAGHRVFIEASPHPVLTAAVTETAEQAVAGQAGAGQAAAGQRTEQRPAVTVTGTLRRDDGGPARLLASLGTAHAAGATVSWPDALPPARQVDLPTYAFQHQRYWPRPAAPAAGDMAAAGLGAVDHPLLGAGVELAAGEGYLLTGRLSVRTHPWLADHAVGGTTLLPGTALVEMAVQAGRIAGCAQVAELALETPLTLPADGGGVDVQVMVGTPDSGGRRPVQVYGRRPAADGESPWTQHASGRLGDGELPGAAALAGEWPPPGAAPVPVDALYADLAARGYEYGPAFRCLRAAWRSGADLFGEVVLAPETPDGGQFGINPMLLDAVLHMIAMADQSGDDTGELLLPHAWTGVSVHRPSASALRARLSPAPAGGWSVTVTDATAEPVMSVESVTLRPVAARDLAAADARGGETFGVEWVPVPPVAGAVAAGRWAVIGADFPGLAVLAAGLALAGVEVRGFADLAGLAAAVRAGEAPPGAVLLPCVGRAAVEHGTREDGAAAADAAAARVAEDNGNNHAEAARTTASQVLRVVQQWLRLEQLETVPLVILTAGAMATAPAEGVADLAGAAVHGLIRSAQSEHPGRLVLADYLGHDLADIADLLPTALASDEPELAIRDGQVYARRVARPSGALVPPADSGPWRLEPVAPGTVEGLALVPYPQAADALEPGQVRIAVRAAGLNFRDVLISLGMYPGTAVLGSEIAGVVTETGPGVTGLTPGDRVLGLAVGGFGPLAVADARLLVPLPDGWSFARAAAVPMAYTTAWYALCDLARAKPGQKLLVHAAASGVGMAAVAIARHLGLEVYATASAGKQPVLAGRGVDPARIASSRDADFAGRFLAATAATGVDIVLNSLAGELTDASLRLLPRGGTFVELGKADRRDPAEVAAGHPGVAYRNLDLAEARPDRVREILTEVTSLLAAGKLPRPPVAAWDVRRAREALRFMSQARQTGKLVLTIPSDPAVPRVAGTVLVTGGTGTLGSLVAGHLAATGRAGALVLAGRQGPAAAGAAGIAAGLAARGAAVQVTACDAADAAALAGLLARIPDGCPLTGVVHTAGVLDDGMTASLTAERVHAVMRPKTDAAWHLHQLTRQADLDHFILFSSAAATFASPGQGSYVAANAFLDGLAAHRRAVGLPAVSLAWGAWVHRAGIGRNLGEDQLSRIGRSGMTEMSAAEGLTLLDAALGRDEALLVPARLDLAGLRARAAQGMDIPALWRGLISPPRATEPAAPVDRAGSLRARLAGLSGTDRDQALQDLVRAHAAAVLGHPSLDAVPVSQAFSQLGFDSLTAVELRNRIQAATGVSLPATVIFDYPNPGALSGYLRTEIAGQEAEGPSVLDELDRLESAIAALPQGGTDRSRLLTRLEALARDLRAGTTDNMENYREIDEATDEEMFSLIDKELET